MYPRCSNPLLSYPSTPGSLSVVSTENGSDPSATSNAKLSVGKNASNLPCSGLYVGAPKIEANSSAVSSDVGKGDAPPAACFDFIFS